MCSFSFGFAFPVICIGLFHLFSDWSEEAQLVFARCVTIFWCIWCNSEFLWWYQGFGIQFSLHNHGWLLISVTYSNFFCVESLLCNFWTHRSDQVLTEMLCNKNFYPEKVCIGRSVETTLWVNLVHRFHFLVNFLEKFWVRRLVDKWKDSCWSRKEKKKKKKERLSITPSESVSNYVQSIKRNPWNLSEIFRYRSPTH